MAFANQTVHQHNSNISNISPYPFDKKAAQLYQWDYQTANSRVNNLKRGDIVYETTPGKLQFAYIGQPAAEVSRPKIVLWIQNKYDQDATRGTDEFDFDPDADGLTNYQMDEIQISAIDVIEHPFYRNKVNLRNGISDKNGRIPVDPAVHAAPGAVLENKVRLVNGNTYDVEAQTIAFTS